MITQQVSTNPIVDSKGMMLPLFYNWMLGVTNLQVLSGIGSPEGLVQAEKTRFYMDETGVPGSILYIKQLSDIAGNRKEGWVALA